jgi:ketosteroid isomerase-like protein
MSQENVELVGRAYEHFRLAGDFSEELIHPDYVWDLSHYTGWPEQQTYHGIDGARRFMTEWIDAWDDWEWQVESLHGAGDKVVSVLRQGGRSKATGVRVEMRFAQLFTLRAGKQIRMEMYDDPDEALAAAGVVRR